MLDQLLDKTSGFLQEILLGAAQISLAGGMETLSSIPFLVRVRFGTQFGKPIELEDFLRHGNIDSYCNMFLPQTADVVATKYGITRREADEYALRSQQRWKQGKICVDRRNPEF